MFTVMFLMFSSIFICLFHFVYICLTGEQCPLIHLLRTEQQSARMSEIRNVG